MENDRGDVRKMLDVFVRETVNELFPTREACVDFYMQDENFARLQTGAQRHRCLFEFDDCVGIAAAMTAQQHRGLVHCMVPRWLNARAARPTLTRQ